MSVYDPFPWVDDDGSDTTGTVVSAERMNHIEQGIHDVSVELDDIELTPGPPGADGAPGPQGDPGPPGLDGLGFRWMGVWAFNVQYLVNDVVNYGGATWVALVDNEFVTCPDHPETWALFVDRGQQGLPGADGAPGEAGPPGEDGAPGAPGADGEDGAPGPPGADGAEGPKGDTGDLGPQGIQGVPGVKGDTGDVGPTGAAGPAGAAGPQGIQGVKGDKGDKGDTGATPTVAAAVYNQGAYSTGVIPAAATWKTLPIGLGGGELIEPAGSFIRNVDGSVSVLDAGWYEINASLQAAAVSVAVQLSLGTAADALGAFALDGDSASAASFARASTSAVVKLAAGQKIFATGWCSAAATTLQLTAFSIARVGGQKGDKGDTGASGIAQYGYEATNATAVTVAPVPAATWTALPTPTGATFEPAGAFIRNGDGTVKVVNAGWYTLNASADYVTAATKTLALTVGGVTKTYQSDVGPNGSSLAVTMSVYIPANADVSVITWVSVAGNVKLAFFSIVRDGAGVKGDTGPAGPVGPAGGPFVKKSMTADWATTAALTVVPGLSHTITAAGKYKIDVVLDSWMHTLGTFVAGLTKNGSGVPFPESLVWQPTVTARMDLVFTWTGDLVPGDVIELRAYANPGGVNVAMAHSSMVVYTVGQGPKGDVGPAGGTMGSANARQTAVPADVNTAGAWIATPIGVCAIEPADAFVVATNSVTVKEAGWYHIAASLMSNQAVGNTLYLAISTLNAAGDGDIANGGSGGGAIYPRVNAAGSVKLAAGAKVYLTGYSSSPSPVNAKLINFSIERIGGPIGPVGPAGPVGPTSSAAQEAWKTIGVDDGTAFENGWTHMYPSTASEPPVQYRKDALGFVHLRGKITGGVEGADMFRLPVGYRPTRRIRASVVAYNSLTGVSYQQVVTIEAGGYISMSFSNEWTDPSGFMDLQSIDFDTEQTAVLVGPPGAIADPAYRKSISTAGSQGGTVNNAPWVYNAAGTCFLDLTPGTWRVECGAMMSSAPQDYAGLGLWNETSGAFVPNSTAENFFIGTAAQQPWTNAKGVAMVTVAVNTRLRIYVIPSGASIQTIPAAAYMEAFLVGPGPPGPAGPVGPPAGQVPNTYTVGGYTVDRTFNPLSSSVNEVANVLATLIADLKASGMIIS